MPSPEEIVRSFAESWSSEQGEIIEQLSESLAALDEYQTALEQWKGELAGKATKLATLEEDAPEKPHKLTPQQASDLALTAELDQARAEVQELRQLLGDVIPQEEGNEEEELVYAGTSTRDAAAPVELQAVEVLEPAVSSVAKQFHKLRKQQAARRGSRRGK